ncbi:histidine kinase N-terminal 7TM domain-containing protein [Haloprofundus sp. MHR1]|uniref:histidine kinase N-terminal 7TM domain-containing protein n=1 Tax=Haloprofundus sp. MHR1 TaxID=2572921 RepID=UPI0010BEE2C9|nr:histidine kinase N-terminal 7TM domain-containing protein [Haloprofundus sp. MHR1]QCJ46672.1 PAS domain S-box protein [Haloprofundus sp. MHR1]
MSALSQLYVVVLATVGIGLTATLLAWRERPEPGATPLVAMLAGQSWWSVFFAFELQATTLAAKAFWSDVQWVGVVVIPVAWVLFAMEYTGRDQYVRSKYIALLSVVPVVTVALAATGDYHDLLYTGSELVVRDDVTTLRREGGPWYWVTASYTYVLGLVGSVPLLGYVRSETSQFRGQSVALLIGTIAPWVSNILFLYGAVPVPGLDPTPVAFAISGVAYLGALTKFRLLGTSPAPNRRARRLVFERMQDAAVVVDSHEYIVDMNESATEMLGTTARAALGRPAGEVLPKYDRVPSVGTTSEHVTVDGRNGRRHYDVTVTEISDFHGRYVGRVIAYHNVDEHLRHQQRLEVLNRVLRHNIRNETNVIYGYADLVADEGGPQSDRAEIIKERAIAIADMGEKARQIVDIFEQVRRDSRAVPVSDLVTERSADVADRYPNAEIRVEALPADAHVNAVLGPALSNLLENAVEHNTGSTPTVEVSATVDDGRVRLVVADDGPGIDVYEQAVLERGTETALEHGSGLGLWLVAWAVGIADGTVEFEENDPTGSVVTVEVPVVSADSENRGEPETAPSRAETSESPTVSE